MYRKVLLASVLVTAVSAQAAVAIQSLAAIEAAVQRFVDSALAAGHDTQVTLGRLDPRLRLAPCEQALAMRFTHEPRANGPNAVEVRCTGDRPWSLYVAVTVDRFADTVVATRALAAGAVITAADVTLARRRQGATRTDYLSDPASAIGQVVARDIAADQILGTANVKLPHLIKRGDEVILASVGGGISVRVKGTALADGAVGARISVRNTSSARVVEGVVTAAGIVVVTNAAVL